MDTVNVLVILFKPVWVGLCKASLHRRGDFLQQLYPPANYIAVSFCPRQNDL